MTVRKLVQAAWSGGTQADDLLLHSVAAITDPVSDEVREVVEDLRDTMWAYDICVGLAAPQIGVGSRIAVVNWSRKRREDDLVLINPTVVNSSGKKDTKRESCMSLWGWTGEVERREKLLVEYSDAHGAPQSLTLKGFPARVVQHEVDHLAGLLYNRLVTSRRLARTDLFDPFDALRIDLEGGA